MDLAVVLTTFALIFPVELPDKTFVATLVLSTRYPGQWVWVGVAAAFAVQCVVAVAAGGLLSLLPDRVVAVVVAILFTVGSIILFRSARTANDAEAEEERELARRETRAATGLRAAVVCFGVLFAAEWGDLSQITTAGLAARYSDPVSVFAGAWIALVTVAAIGVVVGRTLLRYIHPSLVKRIAGTLFAVLALFTWLDVFGVDGPW